MKKHNLIGAALLGALVLCVAFSGCGKKANPLTAGTGIGPPEVAATLPHVTAVISAANGGAQLNNSDQIVIVFDKPMDPATISSSTITVTAYGTGENGAKAGTITYYRDQNRAVFVPTTSFANTTGYIVTVTTGARDLKGNVLDGNGNNLAEAANYDNFRGGVYTAGGLGNVPDLTPPRVDMALYGPRGSGNATNSAILVVFTTNDLDWGSITTDAFAVYDANGNKVGTGSLTVDSVNLGGWRTRAAYNTTSLAAGVVYTVKLLSTVKDRSGNTLDGNGLNGSEAATWDDVQWQFCTQPTSGSGAPPAYSSHNISSDNLVLTVYFSQSMNTSTFTSSNVKVYTANNKTGYVPGTIRSTLAGNGFTYSLENAGTGPLWVWVSRNVNNSLVTGFKLDSNGNGVGGEEGIPWNKFGGPLASDDLWRSVR